MVLWIILIFVKLVWRSQSRIGSKIFAIVEKKKANKDETYRYIQSYYSTYSNIERVIKNFGKTIFLTLEGAEDALAKMGSEMGTLLSAENEFVNLTKRVSGGT